MAKRQAGIIDGFIYQPESLQNVKENSKSIQVFADSFVEPWLFLGGSGLMSAERFSGV